jgi:Sec-independent protein translocase protein TatA
VFGVGPQELLIVAVLCLAVFGPTKFASMARDVGRFTNDARRAVEDVKGELISDEVDEARQAVEETEDTPVTGRESDEYHRGYSP